MRYYDLTYLITPEFSEKEAKDFSQKILNLLQKAGGVLDKIKEPIKISLAYPIEKKRSAYLVSLNFLLGPEKIQDIKKELSFDPNILRFLLFSQKLPKTKKVKVTKVKVPPKRPPEKKVELKEIEKKLEEILAQ